MNSYLLYKSAIVFGLTLLLLIPLLIVQDKIQDRSRYKNIAIKDIQNSWSTDQNIVAPIIELSYRYKSIERQFDKKLGRDVNVEKVKKSAVFAGVASLIIESDVNVEHRSRGIYSIPVYTTKVNLSGKFDSHQLDQLARQIDNFIEWKQAYLVVSVCDLRGIVNQPMLNWNNKQYALVSSDSIKFDQPLISTALGNLDKQQKQNFEFSIDLQLRGSQRLSFTPVGKMNDITIRSNWPHPSFIGKYLPINHEISQEGFNAAWKQSSLSTNSKANLTACKQGKCKELLANYLGVSFIEPVDIYRKTTRSSKYGILIISLVFVAFFLFEILTKTKIHPLQYILVGVSLSLFFLILLSASEFIAFYLAYLLAGLSSVTLIGVYLASILKSNISAMLFSLSLVVLYAIMYIILQAEDFAFLMGSILLFIVMGLLMLSTRKIDWYELESQINIKNHKTKASNV